MTIAPDTPTDIARRQRALVTEAWGYAARHTPPTPPCPRTVWDLPNPTPGWRRLAACWDTDPEAFVVTRGAAGNRAALKICAGCPVTDACRSDDQYTVRGRMLPAERNRWLKDQGIRRPGLASAASQRAEQHRPGRRIPLDVPRIVQLRQGGATFADIAFEVGCTERTAQRRYVEWERQQGGSA